MEYQREGFDMFAAMMDGIKEEAVGFLFNLQVEIEEEGAAEEASVIAEAEAATAAAAAEAAEERHAAHIRAKGLEAPKAPTNLSYSGPAETGEAAAQGPAAADDRTGPRGADCRGRARRHDMRSRSRPVVDGGAVAAGSQVGDGGEVGAVGGLRRDACQPDREVGLADSGWADEQHVGRRFQVAAG